MSENESVVMRHAERLRAARLRLLRMHFDAGVGHIGGNLSALDALLLLHHEVMRPEDVFLLSKGHAAGALYVALWSCGRIEDSVLDTFHAEGTLAAGHPVAGWTTGIPFATGSLGHGLPVASGIALARKLNEEPGRVYCLCSDGEWQEGSNWESLVFASHHALDRLRLIVDVNGLQGFGSTRDVASMGSAEDLRARFESFGVGAEVCDGHDPAAMLSALQRSADAPGPRALLLRTTKGKGVSFMEDKMEWHYLPLDASSYQQACDEVDSGSGGADGSSG